MDIIKVLNLMFNKWVKNLLNKYTKWMLYKIWGLQIKVVIK
jgi:hypothetical protein